jgi:hypothetical protein
MSIVVAGSKITIDRGDDGTVRYTITDELGVVVNITTANFTFTVKEGYQSTTPFFTLVSSKAEIVISSPTGGVLDVVIPSSATQNAGTGPYRYDLQMVLNAKTTTLVKGTFIVDPDITR